MPFVSSEKPRPPLPRAPYLVVGLARSGTAAARLLAERGDEVLGVDSGAPPGAEGLRRAGVEVTLDGQGIELLGRVRAVVKSPGVPGDAPVIAAARARGLTVVGELELAWRLLPNRFVAVTGTNGKTTVTELLGHVWRTAGMPVAVAGNVGTPLASLVGRLEADATVVCECVELPARGQRRVRARVRGDPQRHRRPPRPPRHVRQVSGREAAPVREPGQRRLRRLQSLRPGATRARPRRLRAADRLLPRSRRRPRLRGRPSRRVGLRRRRAAGRNLGAPHDRRPQRRQRDGRRGGRAGDGDRPRRGRGRASQLSRRAPPARAGARARRRPLCQRLEGDQRESGRGGASLVRRRRPRDPRRELEGGELRVAGPGPCRACGGGISDRGDRRAPRARSRAGLGGRGCARQLRHPLRGRPGSSCRGPARCRSAAGTGVRELRRLSRLRGARGDFRSAVAAL